MSKTSLDELREYLIQEYREPDSRKTITTHDAQMQRCTQEWREPDSRKTITSHDVVTARYTEQWIDPAQKLREQERTRKRLAIDAMRQEIERLQEQIAIFKAALGD